MDKTSFLVRQMDLRREDQSRTSAVCFSCIDLKSLHADKLNFLHPEEIEKLETMQYEPRQISYLIGRFCAKNAIQSLVPTLTPAEIRVRSGVFTQPIIDGTNAMHLQTSISHSHGWGAAIVFPEEHPMAIDIERVETDRIATIKTQLTEEESTLISHLSIPKEFGYTLAWTAKESLSKALKCGMTTPFEILELKSIELEGNSFVSVFKNFFQYKAISFPYCDMMCSVIVPKKTDIDFDPVELSQSLQLLRQNSEATNN